MPRFTFRLARLFRPTQWRVQRLRSAISRVDLDLDLPALGGPGWFDSSWDLTQGLSTHEGLPIDAKVDEWIAVSLRS